MKKIITFLMILVALNATVSLMATPQMQQSKPFEQNYRPKVRTKHIMQNEKIWNQEYREYQRKTVKKTIDFKTTNPNIRLKEGKSYNVLGETKVATQTRNVTISQGNNAQYYHRYERNECGTMKVEKYQTPLSMNQFAVNSTSEEFSDIIETSQIHNVSYDSNPNDGWNDQVKDEPIGDAIIPLLLLVLLYIKIKFKG